jgi:hypothetical protein
MRQKLLRHFDPPYICYFCGEGITDLTSNGRDSINTHHIDGDHSNNDPSNWTSAHKGCHTSYHFKGRKHTPEQRRKRSLAMMGNTNGRYGRAGKPK